jgi:hypothetical protein
MMNYPSNYRVQSNRARAELEPLFSSLQSIAIGPNDILYMADLYNHRIRVTNSTYKVSRSPEKENQAASTTPQIHCWQHSIIPER